MRHPSLAAIIQRLPRVTVLVVGDLMLDRTIAGTVDRISGDAPVPVLRQNAVVHHLGGAANVAHSLANLQVKTYLCGVLGDDPEGRTVKARATVAGIHITNLVGRSQSSTTVKTRLEVGGQQLFRFDRDSHLDAPQSQRVACRLEAHLRRAASRPDVILVSDYAKGVVSADVMEVVYRSGIARVLAPKPTATWCRPDHGSLVLNESEARALAGCTPTADLDQAADILRDRYTPAHLVITRGPRGAVLYTGGDVERVPTPHGNTAGSACGAGDAFIAVFTAVLAACDNARSAVRLAVQAASAAVGRAGTCTAHLTDLTAARPRKQKV